VESRLTEDQILAQKVIQELLPHTGRANRIGITGVPGVGKSSMLDTFGMYLIEQGYSVAVLAIDPSSTLHGGSILGDKTRMNRLAYAPEAFIRPSPTDKHLGGVARRTREVMLLCEAFGFDIVIVESVGVGQSEVGLADMVDVFISLMLSGAGDELQGIKKGLLEMVDIIAVNKADGDNIMPAKLAEREYRSALSYLPRRYKCWQAQTACISGLYGIGLPELWTLIQQHRKALMTSGEFEHMRKKQEVKWFHSLLSLRVLQAFFQQNGVNSEIENAESEIENGNLFVGVAVEDIIKQFLPVVSDGSND
jgi:LAO/AO transport system kinase